MSEQMLRGWARDGRDGDTLAPNAAARRAFDPRLTCGSRAFPSSALEAKGLGLIQSCIHWAMKIALKQEG